MKFPWYESHLEILHKQLADFGSIDSHKRLVFVGTTICMHHHIIVWLVADDRADVVKYFAKTHSTAITVMTVINRYALDAEYYFSRHISFFLTLEACK